MNLLVLKVEDRVFLCCFSWLSETAVAVGGTGTEMYLSRIWLEGEQVEQGRMGGEKTRTKEPKESKTKTLQQKRYSVRPQLNANKCKYVFKKPFKVTQTVGRSNLEQ